LLEAAAFLDAAFLAQGFFGFFAYGDLRKISAFFAFVA
jgi:hypothetical protein